MLLFASRKIFITRHITMSFQIFPLERSLQYRQAERGGLTRVGLSGGSLQRQKG
jgi:hypothetical protein